MFQRVTPKFFSGACLLTMGLGCAVVWARSQISTARTVDQTARLVLQETQRDFGLVPAGENLRTSFPLHNAGGRRLIVFQQPSHYECVVARRHRIVVQPGETIELEVVLHTEQLEGSVETELRYTTNDPARPRFTVTLLATVQPGMSSRAILVPIPARSSAGMEP